MNIRSRRAASRRICLAVLVATGFAAVGRADIFWQSAGYSDEQVIGNGNTLAVGGMTFTFQTTIFSDFDGGTFDLTPGANASFLSYESGILGGDGGYLDLSFNNQNNDPADYVELNLLSSHPLQNVQFSLLGIDQSAGGNYRDAVEVFYNGINVRTNPSFFSMGSAVGFDDESYMDGFEGIGTAAAGSSDGNLNLNFGSTFINSLTFRFFTSDDSGNNPPNQSIGIGDVLFVAIPEPTAMLLLAVALAIPMVQARRRAA